MTGSEQPDQALSPTKAALLKIRELKQQLAAAESGQSDKIAIVSMACRFPRRSYTPELFWESLLAGTDEVSEIPNDRWELDVYYDENPDAPGKMYARKGVFLEHLDLMDPEFFGIAPREATWVDPQQRMLMEVSWEALERAGWPADKIRAGTGLFIGWMHNDYQNESSDSLLNLNPYIATGSAGSFLNGRLSYYLGLEGPSLAVDTACSSSLVALHLACQSLQRRECDRALVGGVNAIVSPTTNILTCKLKALSPVGHSRAFDALADGYLRGEGCGVVALRRLADAQRDGDPILGVIRGSAVGHNGFSSGLTAPNPKAQARVIREALRRAGVSPADVDYLEAHGTGTELGDPIEMQAAAAALGEGRDESLPLLVGSVKTNIGHLEAGAGVAGLIKVLLAFQNDTIPAQLNFEEPNPHIAWDRLPVKVVVKPTAWPNGDVRIAGVSAFGMSGTNAHVVVEAPPRDGSARVSAPRSNSRVAPREPADSAHQLLVLSAKSEDALLDLAGSYRHWLAENPSAKLADVAYTAGAGRKHFEYRAAMVVHSAAAAQSLLDDLHRSAESSEVFRGHQRAAPKVAWQFTGQGSQYAGMAKGLYDAEPIFQAALDQADDLLRQWRGRSLLEVLFEDPQAIDHTSWTQPGLFALQMGLAKLLESWGLKPDLVLGHSVGQYAAACVAGLLSWDDGLQLIAERGRLIGDLPAGGVMVAVFAPSGDVESAAAAHAEVSIAAFNGQHTVVSGPREAVDVLLAELSEQGVRARRLETSHAFHSSLMEPALEPFEKAADRITYHPAQLPLVCNMTGQALEPGFTVDGAYWRRHIREAVRYADSIQSAKEFGCDVVLELGPQPVLTRMAAAVWPGDAAGLVGTLQRDADDSQSLMSAVARLYANGIAPEFEALHTRDQKQRLLLPTYPFQKRRFWGPIKPGAYRSEIHTKHALLGGKQRLAGLPREARYESWVAPDSPEWLRDHRVMEDIVFPGAGFIEIALAAAQAGGAGETELRDVVFEQPLRPAERTCLQTIVRTEEQHLAIEIHSLPEGGNVWARHCKATVAPEDGGRRDRVDLAELKLGCSETAEVAEFYELMDQLGLHYGNQFQTIRSLQFSRTDVLAGLETAGDFRGYTIPPTLLDGALHSLAVGLMRDRDSSLFLPVGMRRVQCFSTVPQAAWCHAAWNESEGQMREADLTLFDDDGVVLALIEGLQLRELNRAALRQLSGSGPSRLMYELKWKPSRLPAANHDPSRWLVIRSESPGATTRKMAEAAGARLEEHGQQVQHVALGDDPADREQDCRGLFPTDGTSASWAPLLADWQATSDGTPQGIVWFLGDDVADSRDGQSGATQRHCSGLLGLLAALRDQGLTHLERGLQLVTCGASAMISEKSAGSDGLARPDAAQAQYWGLGRVIGAEQPQLGCRLIDMRDVQQPAEAQAKPLVDVLLNNTHESQIALSNGEQFVPRLRTVKLPTQAQTQPALPVQADRSYLITGGLGVLGRHAGRWLARRGATHVVLVSRRPPGESAVTMIREIEELGCRVFIEHVDLAVRSEVERMVSRFGDDLPLLHGIVHAAGVLNDALLADQSWEQFESVLAPKARGAWLLHELTAEMPLDFFVLYSSAASVLGNPGQSNYATANAFLDGLAWQRHAAGLPCLSVNWGPWTEGMADDERLAKRLALQGIRPLAVDEAHEALESMLAAGVVQSTVLDVDWRRMRMGSGGSFPPLLEDLAATDVRTKAGDSELVEKLKSLSVADKRRLLEKTVQGVLQEVLSTSETLDHDTPVTEMGLDSLMAVEFSVGLQQQLGDDFAIAPTFLYDYPTITTIAGFLLELVAETPATVETASDAPVVPTVDNERDDVAIIGMSCRFPGASGLEEYWDNLRNGVDAVCEIPQDRWDVDKFYSSTRTPGRMYTREGGFLPNIGDFDAEFFNMSPTEACWTDPQHRLMLEVSWEALEHAGIPTHPLPDPRVGVFMGIMSQDYGELLGTIDVEVIDGFQGAGLAHSAGVGRISYAFGFEGPSIAVDSASSSSLVAVHQAARSLLEGKCNLALAGGVNAVLTPTNMLLLSKAELLAPDGRCKSFSAAANGFGRGEGCGVVILKRLRDAERDGDRVLAVIRGSAVCHNGFSGGLTSPSGLAQERLIREALDDANIQPAQVQYLEAHGTGTEFGDPLEIRAAATVFSKGRAADQPLLVGSAKPNIGHLEAAGGISGLIKAVLAMRHGIIPRQLHFDQPSPHVPWDKLPLQIVQEQTAWPGGEERIAGVTALGLSGTNAHVVLSSPQPATPTTEARGDRSHHLLALTARNETALRDLAKHYATRLEDTDSELGNICYTAGIGRRHFEERAAMVVESPEQAGQLVLSLAAGEPAPGLHVGPARTAPKLAWLFGDIPDEPTVAGNILYATEPVFREALDACGVALPDGDSTGAGTGVSLFAVQMGLARLWQSWGIQPDVVTGDGRGQYAAACVTGAMKFEDGLKLAAARDKLQAGAGNAPPGQAALDDFEALADTFDYFPADRPLICDLSGKVVPVHRLLGGSHWRRHCTEASQAAGSLATLVELNCDLCLAIGFGSPRAGGLIAEAASSPLPCLPSLRPQQNETATMLDSLARLFTSGMTPDFAALERPWKRRKVDLPTYPFQRSHYWITDVAKYAGVSR